MKSFTQRWREASDEAEDQPMEDTPTDPKKLEGAGETPMSEPNRTEETPIVFNNEWNDPEWQKVYGNPPVICCSCKKPITEKLDLDLATVPNRGEPMCGACRGQHCD